MLKIVIGVLAASALLAVAGCGKSDAEKKREEAASTAGRGTITCEGSATSDATGLPGDFPQPDAVTYVNVTKSGPTNIVDGFSDESLEGMYIEYKDRFNEAGYTVEFAEIEKDRGDSEVAYKAKNGTSGIVALRAACDNGNISIHITNRPSD